MSERIHILRPDSITPIERYLEQRRRAGAADYKAQVSFACVLFYREREYRSMYSSSWRPDHLPAASAGSPFAPYDLTPQPQAAIAATVHSIWGLAKSVDAPEDLFGLKEEALDGLTQTMRRK
jgi:hypothetical protein